jgi:hypothetical protein
MADIMQNFNTGLDTYITKEQLREICPLAFASEPTNPDVSKKYLFVNTETVIVEEMELSFQSIWFRFRILI